MLFTIFYLSRSIYLYMLFQGGACDISILHEPELLFRTPPSTCCFGLQARLHVNSFDVQRNKSVRCITRLWRCPISPLDQLDRLQPLARLGIIPETNAEKGIAILFCQTFSSPLPGLENQPRCGAPSGRSRRLPQITRPPADYARTPARSRGIASRGIHVILRKT